MCAVDGNHDNAWRIEHLVKQHLDPIFPGIQILREFLLQVPLEGGKTGEIFMVHGHQGTLDSDVFDFLPPQLLPFYRDFQNITNLGHNSPSAMPVCAACRTPFCTAGPARRRI